MGVETAILVAGTAAAAYGANESAKAQKRAAQANAQYAAEQKKMTALGIQQQLDSFDEEAALFMGDQIVSFAKAGVNLSGSALMLAAQDQRRIQRERNTIKLTGENQLRLADYRIRSSNQQAKDYGRLGTINTMTALLQGGAQAYAAHNKLNESGGGSTNYSYTGEQTVPDR